ncbi:MAG: tetratricopeptide repeat protein, partial [bacterium]
MNPNPGTPEGQYPLAMALSLLAMGQLQEAHFECLRALQQEPKRAETLLLHARILREMGRRGPAIEAYLRASEAAPDSLEARVNLGELYWQGHQPEAARPHLEAALALDPDCAEAHQGMAKVLADLRQPEAARAHS